MRIKPIVVNWIQRLVMEAAKRRARLKSEEERIENERKAFWHAHVRGRGLTRGKFRTS